MQVIIDPVGIPDIEIREIDKVVKVLFLVDQVRAG